MPSVITGAHSRQRWPTPPPVTARRAVAREELPPLLPHQTPPDGAWRGWLLLAGRGAGKTYAGARETLRRAEACAYLRIIGPTYADARDVCVEGESGILNIARDRVEAWNRSLGELRFHNGARLKLFSADEPDRLRGPQSAWDWYDELAAWRYAEATFDMAMMGLRLGTDPRYAATTTPRPTPIIRRLIVDPHVATTRATTFDNTHLPDAFKSVILQRYDGTRLGRQELHAEILDDTPGALWQRSQIDACRVTYAPALRRIVVAVDPPASSDGAECGIVVAGIGTDDHGYILADHSTQGTPAAWASAVLQAAAQHQADTIIAERNNGGEMVEHTIRSAAGTMPLAVRTVWASRGKATRAEPISALYEQGRVHHVGALPTLEDQMCAWVPGDASPDRMDALVWALSALFPNHATETPILPTPRVPNRWSNLR